MYKFTAVLLLLPLAALSALTFTQNPSITYNASGQNWSISFGVSENTDVEVAIVRLSDSSIVRRLVAGKLGVNPPVPLQGGTLSQTITWDGTDDSGTLMPAGMYMCRLNSRGSQKSIRMTLVR